MKSIKSILNFYLIVLLLLMSCGKKGHNTERDPSNDQYQEPIDTTDRDINRRNQNPSSELIPRDKVESPLDPKKIQTLKPERLEEMHYLASKEID